MATGNPPNTPPNPQNIQQANADFQAQVNLLRDVFDQASRIQEVLKDQLSLVKEINKEKYNQFELADKLKEAEDALNKSKAKNTDLTSQLGTLNSSLEKKITDGFKAKEKLSARLTELRQKETALAEANARINQGDISAIADQTRLIQEIANKKQAIANEENKIKDLSDLIKADQQTLTNQYGEQEALLANQLIAMLEQENVDQNLVQNLKAKLKFAQANNDEEKDRIEYLKKQLQLNEKQKETLRQIGAQLKINELLVGLTLTGLIKGVIELDQANTDFGRTLGVNKEVADSLTESFKLQQVNAKAYNENLNVAVFNMRNIVEAQNQLNAALGTANVFTTQQAADQVFLTKQLGLSGVEAANLLKLGVLNNQTTKETYTTVADTVVQLIAQTGVALNFRKVLAEVAQISGQLAAQYKNNPKLLAQAVVQAQLLGLTLEQTAKQADSLLNFESSIENELKAELLTNKSLNFERARALALQGKSAEAAAELMKEAGGLEEFQNLNVLQQRALAESVGLTANEMADAVKQQQLLQETGFGTFEQLKAQADSIKDQTARQQFLNQVRQTASGEQLVAQYEEVSLQEKLNALVTSLQESLVMIAEGPIGAILNGLTNMLSTAGGLKVLFSTIAGIMAFNLVSSITSGIQGMVAFARVTKAAVGAEKSLATAKALTAGLTSPLAVGLGLAAAAGAIALINSTIPEGESVNISGGGGGAGANVNTQNTPSYAGSNNELLNGLKEVKEAITEQTRRSSTDKTFVVNMNGDQMGKWSTNASQNQTAFNR
jgi:hypothetical protein